MNYIETFESFLNDYICPGCGKHFNNKDEYKKHNPGNCKKNKIAHENSIKRKEEDVKTLKEREFHCCECGKIIIKKLTDSQYDKVKNNTYRCRSCANRRVVNQETKNKISNTLKNTLSKTENNKNNKICIVCGNSFYSPIKNRKTCSLECHDEYILNRKKYLTNKTIEKLRKGGLNSISIQGNNRRSKNEMFFCELCETEFDNVTHNENIFNGWDADILIYDYKVAILWNGNWHYQEIKNGTSLSQIQNRDRIKISEIKKLGWMPYVIEDRGKHNKTFVHNEFEKLLRFIKEL